MPSMDRAGAHLITNGPKMELETCHKMFQEIWKYKACIDIYSKQHPAWFANAQNWITVKAKSTNTLHAHSKSGVLSKFLWLIQIAGSGLGSLLRLRLLYYAAISHWFRFGLGSPD